jgi:branched-subunit amino acid transport protein
MKWKHHILNIFLLLLPVSICLAVFYPDLQTKHSLTLNTASYSALTLYFTNFVHYDSGHLTRNLIHYIIFGLLSLVLYSNFGYERPSDTHC